MQNRSHEIDDIIAGSYFLGQVQDTLAGITVPKAVVTGLTPSLIEIQIGDLETPEQMAIIAWLRQLPLDAPIVVSDPKVGRTQYTTKTHPELFDPRGKTIDWQQLLSSKISEGNRVEGYTIEFRLADAFRTINLKIDFGGYIEAAARARKCDGMNDMVGFHFVRIFGSLKNEQKALRATKAATEETPRPSLPKEPSSLLRPAPERPRNHSFNDLLADELVDVMRNMKRYSSALNMRPDVRSLIDNTPILAFARDTLCDYPGLRCVLNGITDSGINIAIDTEGNLVERRAVAHWIKELLTPNSVALVTSNNGATKPNVTVLYSEIAMTGLLRDGCSGAIENLQLIVANGLPTLTVSFVEYKSAQINAVVCPELGAHVRVNFPALISQSVDLEPEHAPVGQAIQQLEQLVLASPGRALEL